MTTDIIVQPNGASLSGFDWRMSIAEIAEPAAFSMFDGTDRILTVLDGSLDIRLAGAASMRLHTRSDPLPFAGDAPVYTDIPLCSCQSDVGTVMPSRTDRASWLDVIRHCVETSG